MHTAIYVLTSALLVGAMVASASRRFGIGVGKAVGRVARRKHLTPLLFAAALTLSITVSLAIWMPRPRLHDEFSYLLAADTFAHGRITNPAHPMWRAFETFHVLQQPTYMSKFPPAQGFFLAVGQLLTGLPLFGAWLAFALACAATHWALLAFLPRRWAFTGALMVMLHPVVFGWIQSFWGGSVSLLGGALLLGAFRRLLEKGTGRTPCGPTPTARKRDALLFATGVLLLANSRPFEGLVLTILIGASLLLLSLRGHDLRRMAPTLAILSGAAVAIVILIALYNRAITGNPVLLPHILYQQQYGIAPYFIGGRITTIPAYRYEVMRQFHMHNEMGAVLAQQSLRGVLMATVAKLDIISRAAFELPLTLIPLFPFRSVMILWIPLLALPFVFRQRFWDRWAYGILLVNMSVLFLAFWTQPHYWAPVVPLFTFIWIQSLRQLRLMSRRTTRVGSKVATFLVLVVPLAFLVNVHAISFGYPPEWSGAVVRERMMAALKAFPGKDLVIVRYAAEHDPNFEWVYNDANIDASEVVWAREGEASANRQLMDYFRERRMWLLLADERPPRLSQYR
ncbi:MAG TPA: hypothetical protein VHL58_05315 [Thermoanaerobaculia bacterium]|nr:hypothetical protein [Thermoanaerobaculia bacterium]